MKYVFIMLVLIINFEECFMKNQNFIKGPFKSTIMSVKDCVRTTLPRPKPEYGAVESYYIEIYNTSRKSNLLRGNLTLYYHYGGFSFQCVSFIWKNEKWRRHLAFPNLECKNPLIIFLSKVLNIGYDPKRCSFFKGVYNYSNLDMNKVEHMWAQEREYGRVLWKSEILTKYNTLFCILVETLVEPKSA